MTGFIRVILFFLLFLLVMKIVRAISKFFSSSKPGVDDLHRKQHSEKKQFDDVEDAEFKEITSDNINDREKKQF
jgi:Na+-transporting methylmalonyl-CoA/oxaloacetate decarboxylase gamma subunit